jgi:hypothetical protein
VHASTKNEEGEEIEVHVLFRGLFKGRSFIVCVRVKIVQTTMVEITVTQLKEIIALIVANREMSGRTAPKMSSSQKISGFLKVELVGVNVIILRDSSMLKR